MLTIDTCVPSEQPAPYDPGATDAFNTGILPFLTSSLIVFPCQPVRAQNTLAGGLELAIFY